MKYRKTRFAAVILTIVMAVSGTMATWADDSVQISQQKATMTVGQELQLSVSNASGKVKWKSSKKSVAYVTKEGLVRAKKKGSAVISAKTGKKTLKCKIRVKAVNPEKVYLDATSLTMQKGTKYRLKATVLPAELGKMKLKWKSSNKKVAVVSKSGVVKAKRPGRAKITVTTAEGRKKDVCLVQVKKGKGRSIIVIYSPEALKEKSNTGNTSSTSGSITPVSGNTGTVATPSSDQGNTGTGDPAVPATQSGSDQKPAQSEIPKENTASPKTAVSLTVKCNVSSYAEGERPSQDDFEIFTVYSDGSQEKCGTYSMKAKTSSGQWVCVFTSGALTASINIPIMADVKTIEYISAQCTLSQADPDYEFKLNDINVTEHYSDGSTKSAQAYSVRVESGDGKHVITVTDQGHTTTITVPFTNTGSENEQTQQTQDSYRLTVSMSPSTVNIGEGIADGQLTVKAQNLTTGEVRIITDYACDFTPKSQAGDYSFHVTWNNMTVTAGVTVVDPSTQYKSFTIKYAGSHGNYLLIEEGFNKNDLVINAVMKSGSEKTLTADEFEIRDIALASQDGEDTTIRICLPTGNVRIFSVVSYHRDSLTGKTELSRQKLSSDGEYHVKVGEDFDPTGRIFFLAQTYGGETIEPEYELDFTPKNEPGTYKTHLICRGKVYYTFNIIVDAA